MIAMLDGELPKSFTNLLGPLMGDFQWGFWQDQDELFAAKAAGNIAAPDVCAQMVAQGAQYRVARVVAERVVDVLEVV